MSVKGRLMIFCKQHPRYGATRWKRKRYCASCHLLFILAHQNTKEAADVLGGLNPYQFIDAPLEDAASELTAKLA